MTLCEGTVIMRS